MQHVLSEERSNLAMLRDREKFIALFFSFAAICCVLAQHILEERVVRDQNNTQK